MRKVSVWVLSLVLVLSIAGLALAAGQETGGHGKAKGTLSAVDASAKSITVKSKAGEETFKVADNATLKAGHKTIVLADLKTGDLVQVTFATAGSDKQATMVTVLGEAKPKAAKSGM
jgi:hypothetical protein